MPYIAFNSRGKFIVESVIGVDAVMFWERKRVRERQRERQKERKTDWQRQRRREEK